MSGLERQLCHVLVVLELSALDEDLLAVGGDAREREDLEFKGRARLGRVEVNVELLARPFDDNCVEDVRTNKEGGLRVPGMVAMVEGEVVVVVVVVSVGDGNGQERFAFFWWITHVGRITKRPSRHSCCRSNGTYRESPRKIHEEQD
jgi:hypothetical protein